MGFIYNPPTAESIGAVPTSRQIIAGSNVTVDGGAAADLDDDITIASSGGGGGSGGDSGVVELIAKVDAPAAGIFDLTGFDFSSYSKIVVVVEGVRGTGETIVPGVIFYTASGQVLGSIYVSRESRASSGSNESDWTTGVDACSFLDTNSGNWQVSSAANANYNGELTVYNPNSLLHKSFYLRGTTTEGDSGQSVVTYGGGKIGTTDAITGISIIATVGSGLTEGVVSVYGFRREAPADKLPVLVGTYSVATAGDNFIDIPLDVDDGKQYQMIIRGLLLSDAAIWLRISSDNGATFYSGSSDYKWGGSNADNKIVLTGTSGPDRGFLVSTVIDGMNGGASPRKFGLTGSYFSMPSSGSIGQDTVCGYSSAMAAQDYNALRILASAAVALDDVQVTLIKLQA